MQKRRKTFQISVETLKDDLASKRTYRKLEDPRRIILHVKTNDLRK